MAKEIPGFTYTLEADADLSGKQYYGLALSADGQAAVAGAGVAIIGVLQNADADAAGKVVTIMKDGITKGVAGAAINQGAALEMNSTGKFITLSSGELVGWILGPAAGADGDLITVLLK